MPNPTPNSLALAPASSEAAPVVPQNITINMVTPQTGEATEGLSEIQSGGKFVIQKPDPAKPGVFIKETVNAQGQPL